MFGYESKNTTSDLYSNYFLVENSDSDLEKVTIIQS